MSFVAVLAVAIASCGGDERSSNAFCRQLADELPEIGQPMDTGGDVVAQVARYKRLLKVAPLSIETDFQVLTDLLDAAARMNPNNTDDVQDIADRAYAANMSAQAVSAWVKDTCAVDLATGVTVQPPRVATSTTSTIAVTESTVTTDTPSTGASTTLP
ncbi:MAG: hypothetical protein LW606_04120 [Ilumatobacteraceae bacterium]|nr:hypothetical protein [Ilumatobacteraceae bacterium]